MFQMPVLFIAVVISSPALWQALVVGSMPVETALIRFLIAMPVAAVMVFAFRSATAGSRRARQAAPQRREAAQDSQRDGAHLQGSELNT